MTYKACKIFTGLLTAPHVLMAREWNFCKTSAKSCILARISLSAHDDKIQREWSALSFERVDGGVFSQYRGRLFKVAFRHSFHL